MYEVGELIQDYAKNPVSNYAMSDATISHQEWNPVCWDGINVFLKIWKDLKIEEFSFDGDTSMVTTAAASMLAEEIVDYHINEVLKLDLNFMKNLWLSVSPRRNRAVVLALLATRNAIHKYLDDWQIDDFDDLWVEV